MSRIESALYVGKVIHQRLRPVAHRLEYRVASLLIDVDQLQKGTLPRFFSYNGFNLFSIHDRDYGEGRGSESISAFAWKHVEEQGLTGAVTKVFLLSYPRLLGYGFNPLSTYFALDAAGEVRLIIYEVHNTFGGRHCYVAGPFAAGEAGFATADKTFRVSPFNRIEGHYGLRASLPGETATVGVNLHTDEGPLLKAYFHGERRPFTSGQLLRVFFTLPLMTLKVIGGIHWEALKLLLKGLKLQSP